MNAQRHPEEVKNLRLLAHHDLNGFPNGGEGMGLQQLPGGRRILYIAHDWAPKSYAAVDVTDPTRPRVVAQPDLPHPDVRTNCLAVLDNTLLLSYEAPLKANLRPAGVGVFDVSRPEEPRQIGFFDTSGPHSRGCHFVWWVDGHYAHLSSGARDFVPTNPKDDQFYITVDMSNPSKPTEVGRWWLPGTRQGDDEPPPARHPRFDHYGGYRVHNVNVYPQRPDRAYLGYVDGGVMVLDISNVSTPKMLARLDYHPPFQGYTHTVVPLFDRGLLVVAEEALPYDHCEDWPKLVWVMDNRVETRIVPVSTLPLPSKEEFCLRPGRFGPHNIHENHPLLTSFVSDTLVFGTYFSGGVRVHDLTDPFRPEEVAYYVPPVPEGAEANSLNDIYVDENGIIYAIDRLKGGLYILEPTF